ncbi:hypothetical protein X801_06584, partial [Opisthorchis viverrini]
CKRLHTGTANGQKVLLGLNGSLRGIIKVNKGASASRFVTRWNGKCNPFGKINTRKKRPWSPHPQIYSPLAVMRFSFLHRATGTALVCKRLHTGTANGQKVLLGLNGSLRGIIKVNKGASASRFVTRWNGKCNPFGKINTRKKRPWSPHPQIYSPLAVMRFSFLHRATGTAL